MPLVEIAQPDDYIPWLRLAAEVEPLFGPMVADAGFQSAVRRNIERASAFCVRARAGEAGRPLLGGILWSARPPAYRIGWLAVTAGSRRRGIGRALVEHCLALTAPPAEITVMTFSPESRGGEPARRFYQALGFDPAEMAPGPGGEARQVFRKVL